MDVYIKAYGDDQLHQQKQTMVTSHPPSVYSQTILEVCQDSDHLTCNNEIRAFSGLKDILSTI